MKICIASSGLGHVARGIEAWASDLGWALADRGMKVSLCKGGGRPEAEFERVIPCWQRESAQTKRLLRWLPRRVIWRLGLASGYGIEQTTFALGLLNHLRRERIDILHVQDPQVALIIRRAERLGLVRTRVILAHGTEESYHFLEEFIHLQHLAPWHLETARAAGVWKPTWTAIPNFIDTDLFRPGGFESLRAELGIPPNGLVVVTAAAIKRQHKRIDYLLDEFAGVLNRHPDVPAWLVVAGGWEQETDELVAAGRALLGDRVRFLVRFPRSRMPELYRLADLFVLCSLREMLAIVLLEAMASGTPCVVHRHPVVEWVMGQGGEVIDMATPGVLADALYGLLSRADLRERLGALARQQCLENFSQERVVDQILDYYELVLRHDRHAQPHGPVKVATESAK
jgi:1,2-diacylglycerol 3-alpha-glucosyltransferase